MPERMGLWGSGFEKGKEREGGGGGGGGGGAQTHQVNIDLNHHIVVSKYRDIDVDIVINSKIK
jgi:hypothetical protein